MATATDPFSNALGPHRGQLTRTYSEAELETACLRLKWHTDSNFKNYDMTADAHAILSASSIENANTALQECTGLMDEDYRDICEDIWRAIGRVL